MGWMIGEVARRTGVPTSTLRYWERAGLLPAPERVSGRRSYRRDVLDAIALIQLAQAAGLTVAGIRALIHDTDASASPSDRWAAIAAPFARELDERIAELTRARQTLGVLLECSCVSFRECASHRTTARA